MDIFNDTIFLTVINGGAYIILEFLMDLSHKFLKQEVLYYLGIHHNVVA